jgi:hypothetical protein
LGKRDSTRGFQGWLHAPGSTDECAISLVLEGHCYEEKLNCSRW